jgi:hypothetical protein
MHYIEQSIRPEVKQIEKPDNNGLNQLAHNRLGRAMIFKNGDDRRGEVFGVADSMVPAILHRVNRSLDNKMTTIPEPEPIMEIWKADDKYVMTAVHILSIAGYDTDYGPINKDGKREITTKHSKLLHAVNNILEESAGEVNEKFRAITEPKARSYTVSTIMDEVAYAVFCKLRGENDVPADSELLIYEPKAEDTSGISKPKLNSA